MDNDPIIGQLYNCKCKQAWTGQTVDIQLIRVGEDDCDWRTSDDNSEFDEVNWDVVSWCPVKGVK